MKGLRSICLCLLAFTAAVPALAQLELPDALQGNPLEDKMIGETPESPFHPIHFFSFDGSIVDEISGVSATPSEGVTHTLGYLGGAIYFDGSGIVQLPIDVSPAAVPELTIIAMIKPAPLPEDPDDNPPAIGYIVSDEDGLIIISNQTKPEPRFEAYTGIRDGWQMVAITRKVEDRTTEEGEVAPHTVLKLFTNGRISEAAGIQKQPTIAPKLLLGMKAVNHPYRFRGAIDHLSIYDRALSSDELSDVMARMRQARMSRRSDVMVAGSGSSELSTGTSSATMTDDQRSAAAPAAGITAIGANSPSFTPPVDTADETQDLIESDEGQDMLQSADWRIEGMVPNSQDKSTLYPGDEVTLKIRVSKDDAANKIPSVRLVTNAGPGLPGPSYDLTINTVAAKPTDERDVPITLRVPEMLEFEEGATQVVWRPKVWLNAPDGLPLRDAIVDNHSRELPIVVLNDVVTDECGDVVEGSDGLRATSDCQVYRGEPLSTYPTVDMSTRTQTDFSGYGLSKPEHQFVMQFEGRGSVLGFIKIGERTDKPCRIVIDDAWNDEESSYQLAQVVNRCDGSADDHEELRIPKNWGITALNVCRAEPLKLPGLQPFRVKGVEVEIRPIGVDGQLGEDKDYRVLRQHNCKGDWQGWVRCPDDYVATGINAYLNSTTFNPVRRSLLGLALVCAKPFPRT